MVYAFIIHTLLPGPCKVLYQHVFSQEVYNKAETGTDETDVRNVRREQFYQVASEVHSEYQFRRAVIGRSVEDDIQHLSNDDTLPDFELGFLRLREREPFLEEKIVVWLGTGNTAFTLICEKSENRMLAENVLKILIRFLQEHVRLLNQPSEARLKSDRIALIVNKFLPDGNLIFMNHRVVRQLEKEVEILMKN